MDCEKIGKAALEILVCMCNKFAYKRLTFFGFLISTYSFCYSVLRHYYNRSQVEKMITL